MLCNKKTIFITGASGFIGTKLVKSLENKFEVFCVVLPQDKVAGMNNVIKLDLKDKTGVNAILKEFAGRYKIDVIIHLASEMVSATNAEDLDVFNNNIAITEGILKLIKGINPRKVINFSSIAVYPNLDGTYSEDSLIKPSANSDCLYGLSKFCSENILDFMLRSEGTIISHLRIANVYGNGMRNDRVLPMMIRELKEKNAVSVLGDGERIANFISVDKLVGAVRHFIDNDFEGVFNIGDEHLSFLELADKIIKEKGNKDTKIIKKAEGSRVKFYLDTKKLNSVMKSAEDEGF